jgi:hypothetical protein
VCEWRPAWSVHVSPKYSHAMYPLIEVTARPARPRQYQAICPVRSRTEASTRWNRREMKPATIPNGVSRAHSVPASGARKIAETPAAAPIRSACVAAIPRMGRMRRVA